MYTSITGTGLHSTRCNLHLHDGMSASHNTELCIEEPEPDANSAAPQAHDFNIVDVTLWLQQVLTAARTDGLHLQSENGSLP